MKSTLWEARGSKWIQDQKRFSNRIWSIVSLKDEVLQGSIKLFLVLEIQRAKFSFTEKIGKMWLNFIDSPNCIRMWCLVENERSQQSVSIYNLLHLDGNLQGATRKFKKKTFQKYFANFRRVDGFCCATISNSLHKTLCAISLQKMSSLTPNSQQLTNYFC